MERPIHDIEREISADWKKVNYGAVPYLAAMREMDSIDEAYGFDTGRSVVAYFLSNATTWRGEVARRVKRELNGLLKGGN